MEVILLERIGRLGGLGDVVKVKNGFGRNFLIPAHKALRATEANKKVFEARRAELEKKLAATRGEAEKQAKKMEGVSLTLVRQASEDGKLYGAIGARDIADALKEQGHIVERKQIELPATIKNTGSYIAKLALHSEVVLSIPVTIVRNESEVVVEVPEELRAKEETEEASAADAAAE